MSRIRNLIIALAAFAYTLPYRPIREVAHLRSIVVFQSAKMGDMVCTTPVFRAIKAHYPNARVIVVGIGNINGALLAGSPDVDRYIESGSFIKTVRALRREQPQAAVVVGPDVFAGACAILSGAQTVVLAAVVGQTAYMTRPYQLLLPRTVSTPHYMHEYAPREYLRVLEPLGIVVSDTQKHLAVDATATASVRTRFAALTKSARPVIGIIPSAGHQVKAWPVDRFALVAEHCAKQYQATIVVIGGAPDRKRTEAFIAMLSPQVSVVDTVGQLSIEELKALIAHLTLVVAPDTGAIYIAEALGIPTVDIVGPVDEREQPPIGPIHEVVVPPRIRPELFVMDARSYNMAEVTRQLMATTVPMVTEAVDRLLAKNTSTYE